MCNTHACMHTHTHTHTHACTHTHTCMHTHTHTLMHTHTHTTTKTISHPLEGKRRSIAQYTTNCHVWSSMRYTTGAAEVQLGGYLNHRQVKTQPGCQASYARASGATNLVLFPDPQYGTEVLQWAWQQEITARHDDEREKFSHSITTIIVVSFPGFTCSLGMRLPQHVLTLSTKLVTSSALCTVLATFELCR